MSTTSSVVYDFLSGFGMEAYPIGSAPTDPTYPYITYSCPTSFFDSGEVSVEVDLWYRTSSETVPNAKAREIGEAIGQGGIILRSDDGPVWLKRGTPFCQPVVDSSNLAIKRRYINLSAEYMTL